MDDQRENPNRDNNGDANGGVRSSRRIRKLKAPAKTFVLNVIIALSFALTLFMVVVLLAQNRESNRRTEQLSKEIKAQTDINQRYLRCILLIERDQFANVELRLDAIDKCSIESKTPNGNSSGVQPTDQQRQNFENQPAKEKPTSRTTQPTQTSAPTAQAPAQAAPAPQPQPSAVNNVITTVTKPIKDLLNL